MHVIMITDGFCECLQEVTYIVTNYSTIGSNASPNAPSLLLGSDHSIFYMEFNSKHIYITRSKKTSHIFIIHARKRDEFCPC